MKVSYTQCDGVDEQAVKCVEETSNKANARWISVSTLGETFDYCSPSCFRSFVVQLKRLFPGVV